jgi:preprotein translocase subunit SecG
MRTVLLVVQILTAVGVISLVLLQHGRGADAGAAFGSGTSGTLFGSRGPTSFLTRTTAFLATIFFANSLFLAYLSGQSVETKSVVERVEVSEEELAAPVQQASDLPSLPQGAAQDLPQSPGVADEQSDVPATPSGEAPATPPE